MTFSRRWLSSWLVAAFLSAAVGMAPGLSDEPSDTNHKPSVSSGQKSMPSSPTPSMDLLKLPGDAIFVIGKEIKDALSFSPEMYLLRKEEYAALKARIAQLERLVNPGKPVPPSSCKLTGQVEGDLVHIQARFNFTTTEPRTLVALGCQRAWPTAATMDEGKLPLLLPAGENGWNVQVDSPGVHTLTLDLELTLTTKEGEVGFDLGLPRAAITNLEQFTFADRVLEVRISTLMGRSSGRTVKTKPVDSQHSRLASVPLGDSDRLNLAWKNLAPKPQQGEPLLTSEGTIKVQVDESRVITDVELNLQVRRGETGQWQIQVPPQTTLDLKEPQEGNDRRVKTIKYPTPPDPTLTIELKEPSAETLKVVFHVQQPWTGTPLAVGPFIVVGAFRQWGTIRIAEPPDLRLRYHLHSDVTRREVSGDLGRDHLPSEFSYWNLNNTPGQPLEPLLKLEKVIGTVETKAEHELRLTERGWQIISKFKVTPIRTSVERLQLSIDPQLYDLDVGASSPNVSVEEVALDAPRRLATVKIRKQSRPFILIWPGLYRLKETEQQQGGHLKIELPRCSQTLDRGGQITAILPPEGWELVSGTSLSEEFQPGERECTWRSDRAPLLAELTWRAYRPEFVVNSVADLTLAAGLGRVRHQFHFTLPQGSLSQFRLHIPPALKNRVRLGTKEAKLESDGTVLLAKSLEKERSLTLEYSFPVPLARGSQPDSGGAIDVPLVRVEQAARSETKIRIWSEPGIQPVLVQGPWEESPTEVVAGQDSLPILVLRSLGPDTSLRLQLTEVAGLHSTSVLIDRALIQVSITQENIQSYLARFLLSRINARRLDIQLPGPPAGPIPQVFLGGKRLPVQSAEGGAIRLSVEPQLFREPVVLEIAFKAISEGRNGNGVLQTTLYPPLIKQGVFLGAVRWEVTYPPSWISFYQGGGLVPEQRWAWQGGMLTPQPAMSRAELDRWLTGSAASAVTRSEIATPAEDLEPNLVCHQGSPETLLLLHVSRQVWLLACSLVLLVVGLTLALSPIPRVLSWAFIAILGLAGAGIGIYRPGLLTAMIYGCEPGVVIFAFIMAIQWMLRERYRRRVVFLPGFSRSKPGSSMARAGSADRSRVEPSTVDAPPPTPSGIRELPAELRGS